MFGFCLFIVCFLDIYWLVFFKSLIWFGACVCFVVVLFFCFLFFVYCVLVICLASLLPLCISPRPSPFVSVAVTCMCFTGDTGKHPAAAEAEWCDSLKTASSECRE